MTRLKKRLERRRDLAKTRHPEDAPIENGAPVSDIVAQLRRKMKKIVDEGRGMNPAPETTSATEPGEPSVVLEMNLPGEPVETSRGEVWVNRELHVDYHHGREPAEGYLGTGRALGILARNPALENLDPGTALFIDTETTGLSGGSGTIPFLIGLGWFEDGGFVVEHLFCRDPSEEPAQLEILTDRIGRAGYLVSFNGKTFDIPLINTRFVINRMKNPGHALPHLDLLHVARRIFSRRLPDRSLQNLEKVILGFTREGDIPGALIPGVYVDYLNGLDDGSIGKVLEHNALDILALAALGGVLDRMYEDPVAVAHAADNLGLAKAALGAGALDAASSHLRQAGEFGDDDDRRVALHMEARARKRAKDYKGATLLWERILNDLGDDPYAHLEISKHLEHREKNFVKALEHAKSAMEAEGEEASERRVARIKRKMDRDNG